MIFTLKLNHRIFLLIERIDTERRNAEMKRRRQMEEDEERKKEKQLSDQRRKDLFKGTNDDREYFSTLHTIFSSRDQNCSISSACTSELLLAFSISLYFFEKICGILFLYVFYFQKSSDGFITTA